MKKQKVFTAPLELKADGEGQETGEFRAVFATLNVVDHDSDVTIPGAFKEQETLVEPWNHGWDLPAGKGIVKANDKEAWIEGQFFLDTEVGRENYRTVKNLGPLAEWSYTFYIIKSGEGIYEGDEVRFLQEMDVVGVSPVTRGAGIDTRTEAIKSAGNGDETTSDEDETATDGKSSVGIDTEINLAEIGLIMHRMEIER